MAMADSELLSQLAGRGTGPQGGITQKDAAAAQEKKAAEEEKRQQMLQHFMDPDAKQRLQTIALVKPEKVSATLAGCPSA